MPIYLCPEIQCEVRNQQRSKLPHTVEVSRRYPTLFKLCKHG